MSAFKGHIYTGLATGIGISFANSFYQNFLSIDSNFYLILCIFSMLGSIFPDVDTASTSRKIIYFILLSLIIFFLYNSMLMYSGLIGLFAILPALGKHRGWTHSIFGLVFVTFCVGFCISNIGFPQSYIIASSIYFAFGYLSHLVLDSF